MKNTGVKSMGIVAPFVREGDDIVKIATDAILEATEDGKEIREMDVYGLTESIVARSAGLYVSVDDIAEDIRKKYGEDTSIIIYNMIYSRNRFSMILKGIARGAKKIIMAITPFDEVGNPCGVNPFTGVDIEEYYREIVEGEGCAFVPVHIQADFKIRGSLSDFKSVLLQERAANPGLLNCGLHDYDPKTPEYLGLSIVRKSYTLSDICADKNPDFGLLGTNKATEERLKLFPTRELAARVCREVRLRIKEKTGKNVVVMVYGDGCFHSPAIPGVYGSSINEFADPVSWLSDEYGTEILSRTPNEIKLKALIDKSASDAEVRKMLNSNDGKDLKGKMRAMGTTPRHFGDLLASLMDLTTGSGSRCTPIVRIEGYFN